MLRVPFFNAAAFTNGLRACGAHVAVPALREDRGDESGGREREGDNSKPP